jgi:hypothetical protein
MAANPTTSQDGTRQLAAHRVALTRSRTREEIVFDVLLTTAMVTLIAAPMLFTRSGFALDFTNSLWLTWAAGKGLVAAGHPSFFLNSDVMGVFYPWLAFEGATLLVLTGGFGELLGGHPELAFVSVTTLAIAADYIATLWIARRFGLRGLLAHAPSIAIVTSAYYITNLYGRGAWPEFMAVAALAPLAASGLCLVQAPGWRAGAVLVFALSAIVLTGSHTITLVWAPTMGVLALLVVWVAFGAPRRLPYRRLSMVAGLGALAALVNAWFLLPAAAYEGFVGAHATSTPGVSLWHNTGFFNTPAVLLDPFRSVPGRSTTPGLFVQAPVWFLAWGVLVGGLLVWRGSLGRQVRRSWIAALALVVLVLAMIMIPAFWSIVRFPYDEIQFPYRLCSYVFYGAAGLVLASGVVLDRQRHTQANGVVTCLRVALVAVCAISVGLCIWQQWFASSLFAGSYPDRSEALASTTIAPRTWYNGNEAFSDRSAAVVAASTGRLLLIAPGEVHGDRYAAWREVPDGPQPIQTDIDAGAYLVHISGVQRIGRSPEGLAVVRRVGRMRGPVHIVVETAHGAAIHIGRALSVLAILALLALIGTLACRQYVVGRLKPHPRAERRHGSAVG